MAAGLEIIAVTKSYGSLQALSDVSLTVSAGETLAVLGPSGSGKSTLLGIIAGLEAPDQGDLRWDGSSLLGVPPHRRGFGLMFQDFALFPHLNVHDNVAFGLRMSRWKPEQEKVRVQEVLELVGLDGFEKRDVNTLSGGEQQRVALARSLAPGPRLLMLDEPLGALDRNLRERLTFDLRRILKQVGQTAIYVTHDQEEAFTLADRVALMNAGRIEQVGTPQEMYAQPGSLLAARFLGLSNLIAGKVLSENGEAVFETDIGRLPLGRSEASGPANLLIRPDSASLSDGVYKLEGTVRETAFRGSSCRAVIQIQGREFTFDFMANTRLPAQGERVWLGFNPSQAFQVLR
jgi:ABC-type Fe3+/spermidine/putrescine transport system ATPase subunit